MKKKTADKYWKMNTVMKLNKVTKWDVNLLPFINVFSEEFIKMYYAFFVDMFSIL